MPLLFLAPLAAFLGGIASKLLDGVITLFTKKFLIHAALLIFFASFYAVFMSTISALLSSINFGSIPPLLITGFSVLPSNTDDCISIILGAKLAVLAFKIMQNVLDIRKS